MARIFKVTVEDVDTGISIDFSGAADECKLWLNQAFEIEPYRYGCINVRQLDKLAAFSVAFRVEDCLGSHDIYDEKRRHAYIRLLEIELEG